MRKVPQQEGEKVVEEMSTLDALDCLGVCPANFEWFELNASRLSVCMAANVLVLAWFTTLRGAEVANPPDENCGICQYRLSDGYRCGGGAR